MVAGIRHYARAERIVLDGFAARLAGAPLAKKKKNVQNLRGIIALEP
jgi:hypothetical protein